MEISKVFEYSHKMMMDNANRNVAFDAYRSMYHSGWDLPPAIRNIEWVQKVINADCYDAIQTGMRILSTIPLSLEYQPLAPGQANKERAGKIESVLKWNLMSANRRRAIPVEAEAAKNSLLYHLAALQVVDLEYQIEQKKELKLDTKREENALSFGRFMIVPFDSRSIYPEWSNLGLERVLVVQHKHASEIVDEWGGKATQYPELVDLTSKPYGDDWVTFYDYWDIDTRTSWATQGQRWESPYTTGEQRWVFTHGENPLTFIPFAIRGGSMTESESVHQFQPLLYPIYATGAWDIKNLVESLMVSEVVAHTGSPRLVEEGPNSQMAQIDYMSPDRVAKMPAGNALRQVQPPAIDQALSNVEALLSSQIHKSTISEVLQGGDLPSGTAFASLNLMTQTAVGVLKPYQFLTEAVLADMFSIMLRWVEFTEKDLYGYATDENNEGQEYEIRADEIDPASIYITVSLHPDTPTDRGQKIVAAGQAVNTLDMSYETALSEIGIEDPSLERKKKMAERIQEHEMEMEFTKERLELESSIQVKTQAAILQIQMAAQQAQAGPPGGGQQPPGPPQGPPPGPPPQGPMPPGGPPGQMGPEEFGPQGPEFNPAEGGFPPAGFAPGANAEGAGVPMAPEGGGELL